MKITGPRFSDSPRKNKKGALGWKPGEKRRERASEDTADTAGRGAMDKLSDIDASTTLAGLMPSIWAGVADPYELSLIHI